MNETSEIVQCMNNTYGDKIRDLFKMFMAENEKGICRNDVYEKINKYFKGEFDKKYLYDYVNNMREIIGKIANLSITYPEYDNEFVLKFLYENRYRIEKLLTIQLFLERVRHDQFIKDPVTLNDIPTDIILSYAYIHTFTTEIEPGYKKRYEKILSDKKHEAFYKLYTM